MVNTTEDDKEHLSTLFEVKILQHFLQLTNVLNCLLLCFTHI